MGKFNNENIFKRINKRNIEVYSIVKYKHKSEM